MLSVAFVILSVAVLLGIALAALGLRGKGEAPPRALAWLHGILAPAGLGSLLLALRGPPRGLGLGIAGFGVAAAVLIALAALVGCAMLGTHLLRRRLPAALIAIHATLAVSGFVILAAYLFAG